MAVAEWTGALVDWRAELGALKAWIAPALGRTETRASAGAFHRRPAVACGTQDGVGCWTEQAGLERPHRIQSLSGRGRWSADAARATGVRDQVAEALGCEAGVLVVDGEGGPWPEAAKAA